MSGFAEVAQLVERNLAKVEVAGSNPVFRSESLKDSRACHDGRSHQATWPSGLGEGLQNPLPRFDSGRRLDSGMICPVSPGR